MSKEEFIFRLIYHLVKIYWPLIASQIRRNIKERGIQAAVQELKQAIHDIENTGGMTDDEKNQRLLDAGGYLIGVNPRRLRQPKDATASQV